MASLAAFRKAWQSLATVGDARVVIGQTLVDIHRLYEQLDKLSSFADLPNGKEFYRTALDGERGILETAYNNTLKGLGDGDGLQDWVATKVRNAVNRANQIGATIGDAQSETLSHELARNAGDTAKEAAAAGKTVAKAAKKGAKAVIEGTGDLAGSLLWSTIKGAWPLFLLGGVAVYALFFTDTGRKATKAAAAL